MKIDVQRLVIPFKHSFSHASATRQETETILVKATTSAGVSGYGEGCPRAYVTGETVESAMHFITSYALDFSRLEDLESVIKWHESNTERVDQNPSAWCAVECAILDALSRESKCPIESFLSLQELKGEFNYTAVLGSEGMDTFDVVMSMYQKFGFTEYKLKISGDLELDQKKIELLKSRPDFQLRLDGNNLWKEVDEASRYIEALNYKFVGIEEPLTANSIDLMRRLSIEIDTKIILDESFLKIQDFEKIVADPQHWIINLRISKMGGILRSLKVAEKAKEKNIGLIIGAQVGESSILTRAALTVAGQYKEYLTSQEGAFGTHLLERDITKTPLCFGFKGKLEATEISQLSGLGIEYAL